MAKELKMRLKFICSIFLAATDLFFANFKDIFTEKKVIEISLMAKNISNSQYLL